MNTLEEVVGHAYDRLVNENRRLRNQLEVANHKLEVAEGRAVTAISPGAPTAKAQPDMVADVRAKNTELENRNRALKEQVDSLNLFADGLRKGIDELRKGVDSRRKETMSAYASRMYDWCFETFGMATAISKEERALRLLEESVEVAQVIGVDRAKAHDLVDFVYDKPKGALAQELGGVIVCWSVMCHALGLSAETIMRDAERDCWDRQQQIKEKSASKVARGVVGRGVPLS